MSEFWRILNSLQESSETSKLEDFKFATGVTGQRKKISYTGKCLSETLILLSYCGLVDARIIASEKDLPVLIS